MAASSQGKPEPLWRVAVIMLLQAAGFTWLGLQIWRGAGLPAGEFVRFEWSALAYGAVFAIVLSAVFTALWRRYPDTFDELTRRQAKTYAMFGGRLPWPMIVLVAFCAGIGEEALFRGGLQTFGATLIGIGPAIALSSLAFALIHLSRGLMLVLHCLIGALFGIVFHVSGSLLLVMLAHALYDVWALHYMFKEIDRLGLAMGEDDADPAPPAD